MLPRQFRTPTSVIRLVLKNGRRFSGEFLWVAISQNKTRVSRAAVVVGVKQHKHAVMRNRMKRLVREAMQQLLPGVNPGFDMVFVARRDFSGKSLDEVKKEIKNILRSGFA